MKNVSRRGFLKTSGLAVTGAVIGGTATAKGIVRPEIITAEAKANAKKVNVAFVGIANQGAVDFNAFMKTGLANPVALCDVDLNSKGSQTTIAAAPKAKVFRNYNEMFDKMAGDIDAVLLAIPDFAHFPAAVTAMELGKNVYLEKPMARTFLENEILMNLANKYPKLVTQVGNQGHSGANYFQFKAWFEAGIIKDVTAVTAHFNNSRRWYPWDPNITKFPEAQPLPEGMTEKDWDMWLATTSYKEFNEKYHPGNWRGWYDLGMGAIGDWGAHILDCIHEFLELGLPYEVDPIHLVNHNDFFYPLETTVKFRFPSRGDMPPVDITWYDGEKNLPPLPEGYGDGVAADANIPFSGGAAEGMAGRQGQGQRPQQGQGQGQRPPQGQGQMPPQQAGARRLGPGKIIYSKDLTFKGGTHSATLSIIPEAKAKEMASKLPEVPESPSDHYTNFLKACQGLEKTRSPFQTFGPMAQMFALGCIAQRLNRKLIFDREKKEITNDKFANALLSWAPPRKGWEKYYNL